MWVVTCREEGPSLGWRKTSEVHHDRILSACLHWQQRDAGRRDVLPPDLTAASFTPDGVYSNMEIYHVINLLPQKPPSLEQLVYIESHLLSFSRCRVATDIDTVMTSCLFDGRSNERG